MLTAVLFGLAASSALVIGSLVGARWSPPKRVTGVLLAFASGALISALAFALFEEAFTMGGPARAGVGLLAGAATFVAVDTALDKYISGKSGPDEREVVASAARGGVGLALLAAVTLDGVPENVALGVSLVGGASLSLLAAIFFSNLPESLVGAVAMRSSGTSPRTVVLTWLLCAVLLVVAIVVGRATAAGLSEHVLALALSFAGGAVACLLGRHADARGVRARSAAQRLRDGRRILPLVCPSGLTQDANKSCDPCSVRCVRGLSACRRGHFGYLRVRRSPNGSLLEVGINGGLLERARIRTSARQSRYLPGVPPRK